MQTQLHHHTSQLKQQIEKSIVPSLTSRFQRAMTLAEETWQAKSPQLFGMLDAAVAANEGQPIVEGPKPVTDRDISQYLNKVRFWL